MEQCLTMAESFISSNEKLIMNLVTTCPDIADDWKGNLTQTSAVLGLSEQTIRRAANKGRRNGGIDWTVGKNGRKVFTGKEVKRYWKSY